MFDYQLILENADNGKTRAIAFEICEEYAPNKFHTLVFNIFEVEGNDEKAIERILALVKSCHPDYDFDIRKNVGGEKFDTVNVKHRSKNETKRLSRAVAIYLKEKRENG